MIKSYFSELFDQCGTWDMKAIFEGALSDYNPAGEGEIQQNNFKGLFSVKDNFKGLFSVRENSLWAIESKWDELIKTETEVKPTHFISPGLGIPEQKQFFSHGAFLTGRAHQMEIDKNIF